MVLPTSTPRTSWLVLGEAATQDRFPERHATLKALVQAGEQAETHSSEVVSLVGDSNGPLKEGGKARS